MTLDQPRGLTPRELLVKAAVLTLDVNHAHDHELHSPISKARSKATIVITCSCNMVFAIPNTAEHLHILRNVPMADLSDYGSVA